MPFMDSLLCGLCASMCSCLPFAEEEEEELTKMQQKYGVSTDKDSSEKK